MSRSKSPEPLANFKPRRRRRFLRLLLVLIVVLLVAAWFAPQVVTTEPVRRWLLSKALPGSPAEISFETVSLSWLDPIEINDLIIADELQPVVTVGRVTSSHTLISMLTNPKELGTFRLEAPQVHVVIDEGGQNNLARLLGNRDVTAPTDDNEGRSLPVAAKLEVTDGRLLVTDHTMGREFAAENMSLFATLPVEGVEPISVELSTIALDAGQQGNLNAQMKWWPPQASQVAGEGNAQLQAEKFPITLATALLGAAGIQLQGTGLVNASVECDWRENPQGLSIPLKAVVTGSDIAITLPQLQGDTLRSNAIQVDVNAVADAGKLTINRLHADSDLGTINATGAAPLSTFSAPTHGGVVTDHQLEVDGFVDLPRLAGQLRNSLQLRDDAEITEGQARLLVTSSGAQDRHTIRGQLSTERLAGRVAGKPIEWNEALSVDVSAARANGKLTIEKALCQTPFAMVQLSGDANGGNLSGQSDLAALVTELGQFVDFGELQLAGTANTQGNWRVDGNLVTLNIDTDYRDLVIANGGSTMLQEPRLASRVDFRFSTGQQAVERIESASVQMTSGADQLLVRLKQPVDAPGVASVWPVLCRATGGLTTWNNRLALQSGWQLAGDLDAEADGWVSGSQIEMPNFTTQLTNLAATSGATQVHEPAVKLQGSLRADFATMNVHLNQLTGTSSIVAINSQEIDLSFVENKPALSGVFAFRGDVGRMATLLAPSNSNRIVGQAEGQMRLTPSGEAVRIDGQIALQELAIFGPAPAGQPAVFVEGQQVGKELRVWSERSLAIDIRGNWVPREEVVQLDLLRLTGDEATVDLQGTIAQLTGPAIADLRGNIQYDLEIVSRKLNAERPTGIMLAGRHEGPLTIRGPLIPPSSEDVDQHLTTPLVSPELVASTTLAWDSANLYGVIVGSQSLNLELNQGVLATSGIDATVSGGQLSATPMIDFRKQPIAVTLAGETVLERAQLTPQFCDQWIKYVAPLLAGTATASGDFTAVLNQASIPLTNPHMAELAGRLMVGSARVQPGPMAQTIYTASQDFTSMLSRGNSPFSFMAPDKNWLEISNQQVDFQMTQGRIYHQNLNIGVGDVQVASRGWVGLDQSVAMVTEIPVQDKWLGNSDLLAGLRGQTIQVPLHGTLTRPQLDRRALSQLSTQLIGNTAERLLDNQLQKGLQKLLGPK